MFTEFFSQAVVYLAAAVLAVPLARKLGLGSALGYLLAGVVIGPYVLELVGTEGQDVMHFAEFGVVLMLFIIGLELEPRVLWRMRLSVLGMGGAQMAFTAISLGLVASAFGFNWRESMAVGLILALSSTAIVLQTLTEKGWTKTEAGKDVFSVLLFQDIAVIPMLALLPLLALPGLEATVADTAHATQASGNELQGWMLALEVLVVVSGIVLAGRYLTRPVFRIIAGTRSRELFMAAALLLVIGITMLMEWINLSPALGTFLAGVVLAESEYRHELETNIEPFKGLLLGLFFISVGASIDFGLVFSQPLLILSLVALLMTIKLIVLFSLGRFFRLKTADNLMFSFALAQGGEFAFLLFSFATQNKVLPTELANLLIVVVVLSMVASPLVIMFYDLVIRPRFIDCMAAPEPEEMDMPEYPVIVAGYGRFGQVVARLLKASGFQTTLLDHDAGQIELTSRFGNKVFYGDASREDLLEAAGAGDAQLLVVAIDQRAKAVEMVKTAHRHFPGLKVLARAWDRRHAYELMNAGADVITRETFGSALMMGEEALKLLGMAEGRASRVTETFREHDEAGLHKLYEVWGDDHAYGLRVRQRVEDLEKVLSADAADAEAESAA